MMALLHKFIGASKLNHYFMLGSTMLKGRTMWHSNTRHQMPNGAFDIMVNSLPLSPHYSVVQWHISLLSTHIPTQP